MPRRLGVTLFGSMGSCTSWRSSGLLGSFVHLDGLSFIDFRTLIATNAINVGIDDKEVVLVLRFEIPRDLPPLLQEQKRASRDGRHATFILLSTINAYMNLVREIYSGHNSREDESKEQTSTTGAGSDITPLANRAAAAAAVNVTSDNAPTQSTKKKKNEYTLGPFQKRKLLSRQLREIDDVLQFPYLDLG